MRTIAAALMLALGVAVLSGRAQAQQFNQFVGFGDSTIDSGWYRNLAFPTGVPAIDAGLPAAIANGGGLSTTGPGPVSSQILGSDFGLNVNPANQGGSNYATGGARNNQAGTLPNSVSTVTQIGNYLAANNGVANGNALYLIGSGGNDVSLYAGQVGAAAITPAQGIADVIQSANDLVGAITQLHAAGARYVIVPNQPQSFGTPTEQALRTAYNTALWSGLASAGINFIPSDINAVVSAVAANPSAFGFIAGAGPACNAATIAVSVLLCTPQTLVAADAAQTHFFADAGTHFSTAGQKVVADYEYNLIVAPSMMSMLAEAPLKTRAALVTAIQNQIPLSQRGQSPGGFSTWLTGDISSLKIDNYPGFPNDPGTPVSLTAGFSEKLPNEWLAGVALTTGQQNASFGLGFGSFTQTEFAASGYVAHVAGPFWFDVIGTIGRIGYSIARSVPIGITVQSNTASAVGWNVSLAGDAGINFVSGKFTHGPVLGMTLQHVHVSGFTESGSFTSLGFDAQNRDSAVGDVGYQASYQGEIWRPFVKATWNHEFATQSRLVTASLTTAIAPSFSLPAVVTGTDWATAVAGTTIKLAGNATGLVAFTGAIAERNVTTYGAQVGVNISF